MTVPQGYQPLPTSDSKPTKATFDYTTIHSYGHNADGDSILHMEDEDNPEYPPKKQGALLMIVSHVVTLLSYTAFILFFPVMYWVCVRKLGQSDRLIVFRLGKVQVLVDL